MTTPEIHTARELATHSADIKHMQADMDQMVNAMKDMNATLISINTTLSEAKGGWRMLLLVGGAGGVIGSALSQVASWMPGK
jgi:dihydroorotate dehydrogenase